jgi:hypothetical protein
MKSGEYVAPSFRLPLRPDHCAKDRKGASVPASDPGDDFARAKTRYWYESPKAENALTRTRVRNRYYLGKIDRVANGGR